MKEQKCMFNKTVTIYSASLKALFEVVSHTAKTKKPPL
jgi:hypothetical protein